MNENIMKQLSGFNKKYPAINLILVGSFLKFVGVVIDVNKLGVFYLFK